MNLEEIDSQIADWQSRIALARENIDAFCKLPEYDRVIQHPSALEQTGGGCVLGQRLQELRSSLDAIAEVVDRAASLRANLPAKAPAKSISEIEELLEGSSITVRRGQTPADRRELLRPLEATASVSPRQLLQSMLESFRVLRDSVLQADRGIANEFEQSEHDAAVAGNELSLVKSKLASLLQIRDRASQLEAERLAKVDTEDSGSAVPIPDETVDLICRQVEQINGDLQAHPDEARAQLQQLSRAIDNRMKIEQQRAANAEAALHARRDLGGLLDALIAKAKDRGRASDPELCALAHRAMEMLRRRPTPMKRARAIVADFQARLL